MKTLISATFLLFSLSAYATNIEDVNKGPARFVQKEVTPEINDCYNRISQHSQRKWRCRRGTMPYNLGYYHVLTQPSFDLLILKPNPAPPRNLHKHNCTVEFRVFFPDLIIDVEFWGDVVNVPPTDLEANICVNKAINQAVQDNRFPMKVKIIASP